MIDILYYLNSFDTHLLLVSAGDMVVHIKRKTEKKTDTTCRYDVICYTNSSMTEIRKSNHWICLGISI